MREVEKNCGVWEVEKTAGCGRLKNCGVREVEKIAGCGRLKKVWGAGG